MLFRKQDDHIYSPVTGTYVKLNDINDTTFNSGLMGLGFGICPTEEIITSPMDAEITMVFPTKHAIGLKRKDGLEILIHCGIETVNLGGKGFQLVKKVHDKVKKGDALLHIDRQFILKEGYDLTIIVIFTNCSKYSLSFVPELCKVKSGDVIAHAK